MKEINSDNYFSHRNYLSFLWQKIRSGDLWKAAVSIFGSIRKYTLISGIIRAFVFIVTLLEKSAVLLLIFTCIILIFPVIILLAIIYFGVCTVKFFSLRKTIAKWLVTDMPVTVFVTKERVFSDSSDKLFLRMAKSEASQYTGPVIVVCTDHFIGAKWYSFNLLAVKTDYFFILKRHFIEKNHLVSTFIVL